MAQVHAVVVRAGSEPCAVTGRLAARWLRPYVAGYSAFRAGAEAAGRRVLPLNLIAVTIDFAGTETLVTGARGRITIGELAAELGVGRRRLETGFGQEIGLTPKTVARIARFQEAVQALAAPLSTFSAAVACGYADQPHFNRETRAMSGITPTELRALVQYTTRLTG